MNVNAKQLCAAVKQAQLAVNKKPTIPVLNCVLLETGKVSGMSIGELTLTARYSCDGELDPIAIAPQLLTDALSRFTSPDLQTVAGQLTITEGSRTMKLDGLPAIDFPLVKHMTTELSGPWCDVDALLDAWEHARAACGTDKTRVIITAAQVTIGDGQVRMVTTDSYRMSLVTRECDTSGNVECLIPRHALDILAKLKPRGTVQYAREGELLTVQNSAMTLTTSLQGGQFPNHKQLIPETVDYTIAVSRDELSSAIQAVMIGKHKDTDPALRLNFGDTLIVSKSVPGQYQASESVEYTCDQRPDFTIGCNPQYLLDGLGVLDASDTIELSMTSPLRPMLLSDGRDQYLLMPIKLT